MLVSKFCLLHCHNVTLTFHTLYSTMIQSKYSQNGYDSKEIIHASMLYPMTQNLQRKSIQRLMQKIFQLQKQANDKNIQFLPNKADIQAILLSLELVIFTNFQEDWVKIRDFSIKLISGPVIFLASVSMHKIYVLFFVFVIFTQ